MDERLTEFLSSDDTYQEYRWGDFDTACIYCDHSRWLDRPAGAPLWWRLLDHDEGCPLLSVYREIWAMGTTR